MILVFLVIGMLSACNGNTDEKKEESEPSVVQPIYELTREDSRTDTNKYTTVNLNAVRDKLLITDAGDYMLSGTLSGQIHVKAEEQVVHIFLNNVSVKSATGPALYVESAGKVVLTVCDGTENVFSDGSNYIDDSVDACIYSMNDITINGSGKMVISGYYKDAVHTKDYLKIANAKLSIQSKDDGLHGNDGIMITNANLVVESEGNGIRTTKIGKEWKGNIEISNSTVSVIAGNHAVASSRNIYIASSEAFIKGIISNFKANGEIYIEEGCLSNE